MQKMWREPRQNIPSGTYYVRARVAGKLYVKSLETTVLTVARQRLADEFRNLRARAASVAAVRKGKMQVGDALAIWRDHCGALTTVSRNVSKSALNIAPVLAMASPLGDCACPFPPARTPSLFAD